MDGPSSTTPAGTGPWHVVIPVKDARIGKSRLAATVAGVDEQLRRAIADDTIRAAVTALGPGSVTLVTGDPVLTEAWSAAGVEVVPDSGGGLNAALRAGLASAGAAPAAALLGDLPSLRAEDLVRALAAARAHGQSFVPDHEGVGTVLRCGRHLVPRFGPGSAAAHEADGAVRLDLDLPRLRTDVDDRDSLLRASRLGLGQSTTAALRRLGLG